jgi:hypothetical protein
MAASRSFSSLERVEQVSFLQDPTLRVFVRVDPYSTFHRTELNISW